MDFNYYLPVNLIFGPGKINLLGMETKKYGTKALLVTGTHSTKASGLLDKACRLLEQEGIEVVVFDQVNQNPTTTTASEGNAIAKREKCDVVIGLGGGSIMDCAKAIAFMYYNDGEIFDYIFGVKSGSQSLPLIQVPTTCGTGSEGNCFAVLTNPLNNDKKSLKNMSSVAKVSIIDPDLMKTMPKELIATVGFDALCHNMEAYISKITQPLVEIQTLYSIRLIADSLVRLYEGKGNSEDYEKLTLASTIGGMSINMAGVTAAHGLEHPASGLKDIAHGKGLAALSPVVYEATIDSAPEKFRQMAQLLGGKTELDFVPVLNEMLGALNLKITLGSLGLKKEDVEWMTDNCLKVSAPSLSVHPKSFGRDEIMELYYKSI